MPVRCHRPLCRSLVLTLATLAGPALGEPLPACWSTGGLAQAAAPMCWTMNEAGSDIPAGPASPPAPGAASASSVRPGSASAPGLTISFSGHAYMGVGIAF